MHGVGPRPMRRPQLSTLEDDHTLPPVPIRGRKPRAPRRTLLADYDVGIQPGTAAPLPAPGRGNITVTSDITPRPPRKNRRTPGGSMRYASLPPPRTKEVPEGLGGEGQLGRPDVVREALSRGPALVKKLEDFIAKECQAASEETGELPRPGSEVSYYAHRVALERFMECFETYKGFLGRVAREFDSYVKCNYVSVSELRRIEKGIEEERQNSAAREEVAQKRHREELRQVVKSVQQTRIDNLLSVEVERLQQRARELEERLKRTEWENRQLIERNGNLTLRIQEREPERRPAAEAESGGNSLSLPPNTVPKCDNFVNGLSRCLMLSLRALEERRREEALQKQNSGGVAGLQERLGELRVELLATQDALRGAHAERDAALRAANEARAETRTLATAASGSSDERVQRLAHELDHASNRLSAAEVLIARERVDFKAALLRMQAKMSRVRALCSDAA
eukprot:Hpha_TRINITY_DN18970_c0_g1::TRINITY_DN18970_c0_g1_i1::g.17614::m.17614